MSHATPPSRRARLPLAALLAALVLPLLVGIGRPAAGHAEQERVTATEDRTQQLLDEVQRLLEEMRGVREELAQAQLEANASKRELEELRVFIRDHERYGRDFQEYESIKGLAQRNAEQQDVDVRRQRFEDQLAARRERAEAVRAAREARQAEDDRAGRYRKAGFEEIGLGVHIGKMGFSYRTINGNGILADYDPIIGLYYRPGLNQGRIDFSRMTLSGAVLNATPEVRNIGIAVSFFDENGNQVGAEIVKIENARPDVPYPFTQTIEMALNRPFSSSSSYVLYADPVLP